VGKPALLNEEADKVFGQCDISRIVEYRCTQNAALYGKRLAVDVVDRPFDRCRVFRSSLLAWWS
jgi:hypothetical protein